MTQVGRSDSLGTESSGRTSESLQTRMRRNWNQLVREMYQWHQFGRMIKLEPPSSY